MSVISAPPRKDIYLLWGNYGALGGALVHPRARLWLLTHDAADSPDAPVFARAAWNHPSTGQVQYQELGDVAQATLRATGSAEVHLASGQVVTFVPAPCVCGAGAVGQAPPDEGRINLNWVNPYNRSRIVFV